MHPTMERSCEPRFAPLPRPFRVEREQANRRYAVVDGGSPIGIGGGLMHLVRFQPATSGCTRRP